MLLGRTNNAQINIMQKQQADWHNLPFQGQHPIQLQSSKSACLETPASQHRHPFSQTYQLSQACHRD